MKGTLGQPKFRQEDLVTFSYELGGETHTLNGAVYVVDAMGTSEQNEEPSYDIEALFDGEITLFKHVRESDVKNRTE